MRFHAPKRTSPELARVMDELAEHCFVCGPANPQGLHVEFAEVPGEPVSVVARVTLTRFHEGPPGYGHGGIIATLLDEAMGKLSLALDCLALTRHMEVDYLRPVRLGVALTLTATHVGREGRKLRNRAELRDEAGVLLAASTGLFIVVDPLRVGLG